MSATELAQDVPRRRRWLYAGRFARACSVTVTYMMFMMPTLATTKEIEAIDPEQDLQ